MSQELHKTISALSGALMCIGVNIGAGIFIVPGIMLTEPTNLSIIPGIFIVPGIMLQLVGSVGMVLILFLFGGFSCFLATVNLHVFIYSGRMLNWG